MKFSLKKGILATATLLSAVVLGACGTWQRIYRRKWLCRDCDANEIDGTMDFGRQQHGDGIGEARI